MIATLRRRVRSRTKVVAAFLPFVAVVAFVFAVNVFMDAQTLTPAQEAQAELGDASSKITLFEAEFPAGTRAGQQLSAMVSRVDPRAAMSINAIDFPYYAGDARGIYFQEMNWRAHPPTTQYELLDGRWPRSPGEVAIVGEGPRAAAVGDEVPTLGGGEPLTVVGVGQPRWVGSPIMLAAPGTWASLPRVDAGKTRITAFPSFAYFGPEPADLVGVTRQTLKAADVAPYAEQPTGQLDDQLAAKLRTRRASGAEAARLWSAQSPLSLRVPGLVLVPTTVLIGYLVLMRRFVTTARRMTAQGVRGRDALLALWFVPMPALVLLSCVAAVAGSAVGATAAEIGVGQWGYYTANWRYPWEATGILAGGLVLASAAALAAIRGRVVGARSAPVQRHQGRSRRLAGARQISAGLLAAACLWKILTVSSGSDAMVLTALAILLATLLTPELVDAMVRLMPSGSLTQRLVARQMAHNRSRIAAAATTYIALVGVTIGFVVVLATYSQQLLEREPSAPPAGQVLVDNDGNAFLPVDSGVRAVLESQPGFSGQVPTQLFLLGSTYQSKAGTTQVRDAVGAPDFPAVSFAFRTVGDVEQAYGRPLTNDERAMLASGGALVPRPDRVSITDGHLQLVDIGDLHPEGRIRALDAEPVPTPWADTPLVMLVSTATDRGMAHQAAALIYHGVDAAEADRAEQALVAAGYSPRIMNKHARPPSVLPPAALLGSAAALLALVVAMSVLVSRAQVQGMRAWASRLTQIGVQHRWASRALTRQYLWTLAFSVPVGLLVTLGAMRVTQWQLPELELVIPWSEVAGIVAAIVVATAIGATMAARNLHRSDNFET